MKAACSGQGTYAKSRVAVCVHVQKPHATQLLTTAEAPTPAIACCFTLFQATLNKFRRLCHQIKPTAPAPVDTTYGKPKSLAS